jgi:chromosome segregation ATPase
MQLPAPLSVLDSARLDALSRHLAEAAAELAGRRSELRSRAAELRWHSPAARAFATVLHELLGQLGQSSNRLAELSATVRAHRQRAGDRAAALARIAHGGLAAVEHLVRLS